MALNEILDRKTNYFIENKLNEFDVIVYCSSLEPKPDKLIDRIDEFIININDVEHREYILLKIFEHLDSIEFTEKNTNAYTSYKPESIQRFNKNRTLVTDHILLKLESLDYKFDTEMYSKKEFEDLLSQIDKIAESLFEFQTKYATTNETLYQSVEEIKEQLKKDAKKGRIFGKEFVIQQIAGKLMDMSFKGAAKAFLSNAPEKLSDLANHIQSLL